MGKRQQKRLKGLNALTSNHCSSIQVKYKGYSILRDSRLRNFNSNVYDILVDQGATLNRALFVKTAAKNTIDLAGFTGRMHIRDYKNSSIIIQTLTSQTNEIALFPAAGRVDILLSPAKTASLTAKNYVYDLELESLDGEVTKILSGKLTVRSEITY